MNIFRKLAEKNDSKHDLQLAGLYLLCMLAALVLAAAFVLYEPGSVAGVSVENIMYVLKISFAAALCFFALYCFIRIVSTFITIIRRKS